MAYLEDRENVVSTGALSQLLLDSGYQTGTANPFRNAGGVRLSIAMAAHNEEATIRTAIERILAVDGPFEIELVVVDDGSTDRTRHIVESFDDPRITFVCHEINQGKGAAIMTAAALATGTHILVFDADLEYDARDIPALVAPIAAGTASIVYGARLRGTNTEFPSFTYALGGKATTIFTNLIFNSWMSDMHTCLKLMPLHLFRQLSLSESGFGLDTEMTCEVLRRGYRPYEVPCSYKGRSAAEGKKISPRDGVECLKVAVQVRLRGRLKAAPLALEPLHVVAGEIEPLVSDEPSLPETVTPAEHSSIRPRRFKRNAYAAAGHAESH